MVILQIELFNAEPILSIWDITGVYPFKCSTMK